VLDVGANFGQMSVLFSNLAGDDGTVHSFEADDFVYDIFKRNIDANDKVGRIIPHFGAVHNADNETLIFPVQDFQEFGTYGSYGIDYNAAEGRKVQSLTIDSLNIAGPISFMKIDIQGGDLQGMQGAVKTIHRNRMPILFEDEALSGKHDLVGGGPTAVALYSNELSRARGGPRCMTMPLERDPL